MLMGIVKIPFSRPGTQNMIYEKSHSIRYGLKKKGTPKELTIEP